jgi:hypothetical protein
MFTKEQKQQKKIVEKQQLKEFKVFQKKIDLKTNEKDIYESIAVKTKNSEFVFEEV